MHGLQKGLALPLEMGGPGQQRHGKALVGVDTDCPWNSVHSRPCRATPRLRYPVATTSTTVGGSVVVPPLKVSVKRGTAGLSLVHAIL